MTKCSILNTEYKYGRLIGAWVKFHQSEGSQASGLNHVEDFLLPLVGIWEPKKLVVLAFQELHLQNKS